MSAIPAPPHDDSAAEDSSPPWRYIDAGAAPCRARTWCLLAHGHNGPCHEIPRYPIPPSDLVASGGHEEAVVSARMVAMLRCDHTGCEQRFAWSNEHEARRLPRLGDARKQARSEGWRHGVRLRDDAGPAPTFDFCPEHADDVAGYHEVTL